MLKVVALPPVAIGDRSTPIDVRSAAYAGRVPRSRAAAVLRWILLGLVLAVGVLTGIGVAHDYYHSRVGDWRVGAYAILIGAAISIGTAVLVFGVAWLTRTEERMARARRAVIQSVAFLLSVGGALGGAGAGYAYEDVNDNIPGAVFVGIGAALGSWLLAALLSLLVEMANSLRVSARSAGASVPSVLPTDVPTAD